MLFIINFICLRLFFILLAFVSILNCSEEVDCQELLNKNKELFLQIKKPGVDNLLLGAKLTVKKELKVKDVSMGAFSADNRYLLINYAHAPNVLFLYLLDKDNSLSDSQTYEYDVKPITVRFDGNNKFIVGFYNGDIILETFDKLKKTQTEQLTSLYGNIEAMEFSADLEYVMFFAERCLSLYNLKEKKEIESVPFKKDNLSEPHVSSILISKNNKYALINYYDASAQRLYYVKLPNLLNFEIETDTSSNAYNYKLFNFEDENISNEKFGCGHFQQQIKKIEFLGSKHIFRSNNLSRASLIDLTNKFTSKKLISNPDDQLISIAAISSDNNFLLDIKGSLFDLSKLWIFNDFNSKQLKFILALNDGKKTIVNIKKTKLFDEPIKNRLCSYFILKNHLVLDLVSLVLSYYTNSDETEKRIISFKTV